MSAPQISSFFNFTPPTFMYSIGKVFLTIIVIIGIIAALLHFMSMLKNRHEY